MKSFQYRVGDDVYANYSWDVKPHMTGFEMTDVAILNQNVTNNVNPKCCVCISPTSWYFVVDK